MQVDLIDGSTAGLNINAKANENVEFEEERMRKRIEELEREPPQIGIVRQNTKGEDQDESKQLAFDSQTPTEVTIMTKEEAKTVMKGKDFEHFISKSVNIMERALNQDYDITAKFLTRDEKDGVSGSEVSKHDKLAH